MEEVYKLLISSLAFPVLFALVWLAKNKKRGLQKFVNLRFRRSRVVKVNLHTASGRNIECFPVPNSRGYVKVEGGLYRVVKEFSIWNAAYRIPEYDVIEAQIVPSDTTIGKIETEETEVEVVGKDGTIQKQKQKVPTYVISHQRSVPKSMEGRMAQEVHDMLDSKIIADIDASSDAVMNDVKLTKILVFVLLALTLVGFVLIWNKVDSVSDQMAYLATGRGI
jgi:hypothetical protein